MSTCNVSGQLILVGNDLYYTFLPVAPSYIVYALNQQINGQCIEQL